MLAASLSALSSTPAAAPAPAAPAAPGSGEGSFAHTLDQARRAPAHPKGGIRETAKPTKDSHRADPAGAKPAEKAAEKTDKSDKAEAKAEDGPKADGEAGPADEQKAAAADAQSPTAPDLAHLLPGWAPPQRGEAKAEPGQADGSAEDNAPGAAASGPRGKGLPGAAADAGGVQARRDAADKADGNRSSGFAAELSAAQGDDKAAAGERAAPVQNPALTAADAASAGAALAATQHTAGTGTTAGAQRGEAPRFEAQLSAAVGSPEFAPALGVQVSILAREGVQEARLHLNPADMGPISVQIAVNGTQAEVNFQADVAATRQALESSLPDLAAALRDSGLTMSGGGVSEQPRDTGRQAAAGDDSGRNTGGGRGRGRDEGGVDGLAGSSAAGARVARPQGVVDLYA